MQRHASFKEMERRGGEEGGREGERGRKRKRERERVEREEAVS